MTEIKKDDKVAIHYTGKLEDGTVFDSSVDREPLEFVVGSNQVIPGVDNAVMSMTPGEKKTVEIAPEEAYGPHRAEMVITTGKDQIPSGIDLQVGQRLQSKQPDGQNVIFNVTEIKDDTVTLDANHPLAGKTLTFEIELLKAG